MKSFRFFFLPLFTIVTLAFSLSPWLYGLLKTPDGQVFGGVNRWSADYYIYVSFVETGIRGKLKEYHLTTTKPQEPILIHGIYTISGYVGKLIGLDSIAVYHLDRIFLGGLFILALYFLYMSVFKRLFWSALAMIFVFWTTGFPQTLDIFGRWDLRNLYEVQETNIVGRSTGPPHYLLGFIFFILSVWYFMVGKASVLKKSIILILLATAMTVANPANLLTFLGTIGMYTILRIVAIAASTIQNFCTGRSRAIRNTFKRWIFSDEGLHVWLLPLFVALGSIPVSLYYKAKLSIFPWGPRSNALKFYTPGPPISYKELILSMGPMLVFAVAGMIIWGIKEVRKSKLKTKTSGDTWFFLFFSWLIVQFGLMILAMNPKYGIDPLRFLQGLYYIPMAVFAVVGVKFLAEFIGRIRLLQKVGKENTWMIVLVAFSVIVTIPTLVLSYREHLFMNTDYKTFPTHMYPSKYQVEGYKWLERNTPFASGVLAFYEVTEVLPAFSGNATERDIWFKDKLPFFSNKLLVKDAYAFLKKYRFGYVWAGYQEWSAGFDSLRYPFLTKVFENKEVKIYKVKK